jgi:Pyruvate/2-oxoacid:ferredoxin oxidoreductase delta subunit
VRKIVEIDESRCNGCGQCVLACAEGAIQVVDGKARLVSENFCDGLGACLGECPQGAIRIIERDAENFDPKAVERHNMEKAMSKKSLKNLVPPGCPSSCMETFAPPPAEKPVQSSKEKIPSALSHWPVQIRLVPPAAPFLKGAHILVAADCTPIAYPEFHHDFLKGKSVMIGCPKFDDARLYLQKFTEIFKTADIKSVTVVAMEVPCCQRFFLIIDKALELAGKDIPLEEITISPKGKIIMKERITAYA